MTQNGWNNQISSATVTFSGGGFSAGDDASTYPIKIGTGGAARLITIGNTTGATGVLLYTGTQGFTVTSATGTLIRAQASGHITMPLQTAFSVYLPSAAINVTGDGTEHILGSVTAVEKIYDQNVDVTTAGIFTAPVNGVYLFTGTLHVIGIGSAHTELTAWIDTPHFIAYNWLINPYAVSTSGYFRFPITAYALMDAGDSCRLKLTVNGGTKTVSVHGAAALVSSFSGKLVC